MNYPIAVHLPVDLFHALVDATGEHWFGNATEAALCDAVRLWLARHRHEVGPAVTRADSGTGYQWKQLFLPEGTTLRCAFQGEAIYATVEGERIVCGGKPLSPSQFANVRGNGARNAWRVVWLRFPDSPQWKRAADCRPRRTG